MPVTGLVDANGYFWQWPAETHATMRVEAAIAELAKWLPDLLAQVRPDPVLYNAGVDPRRDDALGKLALTDAGLLRRDRYVLEECVRRGVPVATVIGGGYSKDIDALARRHTLVHCAASEAYKLV